jgi:hypothetical protein
LRCDLSAASGTASGTDTRTDRHTHTHTHTLGGEGKRGGPHMLDLGGLVRRWRILTTLGDGKTKRAAHAREGSFVGNYWEGG